MCIGTERVGQELTALCEGTKEVDELRDLKYGLDQIARTLSRAYRPL
jgi:hypothetical protein